MKEEALYLIKCAKEKLLRVGWTRGALAKNKSRRNPIGWATPEENVGGYCIMGALYSCANNRSEMGNNDQPTPVGVARQEIEKRITTGSKKVETFNDQNARSKQQVINLLDKTIHDLEVELGASNNSSTG